MYHWWTVSWNLSFHECFIVYHIVSWLNCSVAPLVVGPAKYPVVKLVPVNWIVPLVLLCMSCGLHLWFSKSPCYGRLVVSIWTREISRWSSTYLWTELYWVVLLYMICGLYLWFSKSLCYGRLVVSSQSREISRWSSAYLWAELYLCCSCASVLD